MIHHWDPFLWRISENFGLRWYGFSYMMGFFICYLFVRWLVLRQKSQMNLQQLGDFVSYAALGVLLGGRFGYCLFYAPELFLKFRSDFPYWGVFALNEGGMSAHGGIIGLLLACILFSMRTGVSQLYLYDLVSISGPIGIFLGRIANFINGELVGRPCDPQFPLAVKFPQDIYSWPQYEPEKLKELLPVVEALKDVPAEKYQAWVDSFASSYESRNEVSNVLVRIVEAIQAGNEQVQAAIAPLLTARHPSQLYASLTEGLLVFLILFIFWYRPRKPGIVGCLFLVLYSLARIGNEFFRMPDAHIGYELFNLTRGQWLGVLGFFIGSVLLFMWGRRDTLPMPGWGQGQSVKLHRK